MKLIFPGRKFVREGKLTKVSGSHVQDRQFFLFNDILIYAKPALVKKQFEFKGLIPLNRLVVRDLANSSCTCPDINCCLFCISLLCLSWALDSAAMLTWYSEKECD